MLALTEAARSDIVRWTHAAASNVIVVPPGPRKSWPGDPHEDLDRLADAGVMEPFVLTVAASYPHKNLERLVQAFPEGCQPGRPGSGRPEGAFPSRPRGGSRAPPSAHQGAWLGGRFSPGEPVQTFARTGLSITL